MFNMLKTTETQSGASCTHYFRGGKCVCVCVCVCVCGGGGSSSDTQQLQ